ncbi:hypothetical protein PoB_006769800 [Plakobranchus ocellatus]|uniref:Uncharacterized protein n=1 Tax=Plakobranchus ocellatus TaxID=259542 RepID=A0AAV4DAF6_9GAST|nr:hypothetical protein PoB_006769800 [Plakobranchus ocellatus]
MKTLTAENTNRTNGQGANGDPNSDVFAKIVTLVKERKPKDVQAVKSIVNNYCDAHPDIQLGKIFNVGNSCTKADKVDSHGKKTAKNHHQNFREGPRVRARSEERFSARQNRQGWYQSSRPMDNRAITTDSIIDTIGDHHIGHATMDQDALVICLGGIMLPASIGRSDLTTNLISTQMLLATTRTHLQGYL